MVKLVCNNLFQIMGDDFMYLVSQDKKKIVLMDKVEYFALLTGSPRIDTKKAVI